MLGLSLTGLGHFASALLALICGGVVFFQKKGTRAHRIWGRVYGVAMVVLNAAGLNTYGIDGNFGPFHWMALVSLITLSAGLLPVWLRKPQGGWLELHAHFISWSYVGLVAAGVSQIATQLSDWPPLLAVGLPSAVVLGGGALLIHGRVPGILSKSFR